jgi:zinc protease
LLDRVLPPVEIQSVTLENGLRFSANETKDVDSITFSGSIRAGSIYDKEGKLGTAEIVSRLLTRGNKSNPRTSILSRKIEEIGATLQFANEDERVRFSARCHSSVVSNLLEIISECIMAPAFAPEQIELTRAEIISDIDSELDETRTRAHRLLMPLIYGETNPFGRNPLGDSSHLKDISSKDIMKFHDENYAPNETLIVATGNFDFSDLSSKIDSYFGKWSRSQKRAPLQSLSSSWTEGKREPIAVSRDAGGNSKLLIESMAHKSQVDIALGLIAVPRKSNHYYPLSLGNLLLGQIGLYGRLGKNVREEKGLAYYSFSSLVAKTLTGHIAIYAGVNPKNIASAIDGIVEEISRIRLEEIGKEELERGKRNALGSLAISLDTSTDRVGIIHEIEYYSLGGSKFFEDHETKVNSVTAEQIQRAFFEFANPSKISMAVVGPVQDPKQIRPPGEIIHKEV